MIAIPFSNQHAPVTFQQIAPMSVPLRLIAISKNRSMAIRQPNETFSRNHGNASLLCSGPRPSSRRTIWSRIKKTHSQSQLEYSPKVREKLEMAIHMSNFNVNEIRKIITLIMSLRIWFEKRNKRVSVESSKVGIYTFLWKDCNNVL
jgi:hypothetical protein